MKSYFDLVKVRGHMSLLHLFSLFPSALELAPSLVWPELLSHIKIVSSSGRYLDIEVLGP